MRDAIQDPRRREQQDPDAAVPKRLQSPAVEPSGREVNDTDRSVHNEGVEDGTV